MSMTFRSLLVLAGTACLMILLFVAGGGQSALDPRIVQELVHWRAGQPEVTAAASLLTHVGSGPVLLASSLGAGAWLMLRAQRVDAAYLLLSVIGGRLLIELVKWATDRSRPSFEEHPVYVASQSFPSGHAGNSMMTFLALALFAVPAPHRSRAVILAVTLSLLIGATRPLLGVHWPTDVLAGWLLGAAWIWLWWQARIKRA